MKNQIVDIPIDQLNKAPWNYKTDGTEEQIQKLANAIREANSCGVFMVREIQNENGELIFEVMDGNHRLDAAKREGWKSIPCENFGRISQAKAIILTRQRNQNWFDDDKLKLANLFSDFVFPEYEKDFLASILPETIESLETLGLLANPNWQNPIIDGDKGSSGSFDDDQYKKILLTIPEETFNLWMKWKNRLKDSAGIEEEYKAFEYAIIEALNVPEDEWQQKFQNDLSHHNKN